MPRGSPTAKQTWNMCEDNWDTMSKQTAIYSYSVKIGYSCTVFFSLNFQNQPAMNSPDWTEPESINPGQDFNTTPLFWTFTMSDCECIPVRLCTLINHFELRIKRATTPQVQSQFQGANHSLGQGAIRDTCIQANVHKGEKDTPHKKIKVLRSLGRGEPDVCSINSSWDSIIELFTCNSWIQEAFVLLVKGLPIWD